MKTEKKEKSAAKKQKGKFSFLFRFLVKTALIILAVFLVLTFVLQIFRMTGNNMYPYISDGDLCVFYRLDDLYLNDVVLYEDEDGRKCVGRIIASGGQVVSFAKEGGYTVDGYEPIEENPYETYEAEDGNVLYPLHLAEDEYFVLNDFRKLTTDSREKGTIKRSQIKGKLLLLMRRRNF